MNTHRIDVLHVADGDRRVVGVPHDLVLDLLVALDGLFHQNLMDRGQRQCVFQHQGAFLRVVGKAAAGAAQREGRPQHNGIADVLGGLQTFFQRICHFAGKDGFVQRSTQLLEQLPVLRPLDGLEACAQNLAVAFVQNALLCQLHRKVQAGLSAQRGQNGVGALMADDSRHIFQCQGLHVNLVRNVRICHDGGGVGVDENHLVPLFPERQTGLGAGVVKFGGLSDDDGAGADHENFMNVSSFRHDAFPPLLRPSAE